MCVCEWTASRFGEARENAPADCILQSVAITETALFFEFFATKIVALNKRFFVWVMDLFVVL